MLIFRSILFSTSQLALSWYLKAVGNVRALALEADRRQNMSVLPLLVASMAPESHL